MNAVKLMILHILLKKMSVLVLHNELLLHDLNK